MTSSGLVAVSLVKQFNALWPFFGEAPVVKGKRGLLLIDPSGMHLALETSDKWDCLCNENCPGSKENSLNLTSIQLKELKKYFNLFKPPP